MKKLITLILLTCSLCFSGTIIWKIPINFVKDDKGNLSFEDNDNLCYSYYNNATNIKLSNGLLQFDFISVKCDCKKHEIIDLTKNKIFFQEVR